MQDRNLNSNATFQKLSVPISAKFALGEVLSIKEPLLIGDWVIWLEQRPIEGGRTTAVIRPWGHKELVPQELTPAPLNVRSRIHVYGGGAFSAFIEDKKLLIAWIDDSNGCLWSQTFSVNSKLSIGEGKFFNPCSAPICLSIKTDNYLGGGLIDISRKIWIGILEQSGKDYIVSFQLNAANQKPRIIHSALDFAGYPVLNKTFDQIAWVEWQEPYMPWDSSQLWWGHLDNDGEILNKKLIAGNQYDDKTKISVFQPFWLNNGDLLVSEDRSGWWNLMITNTSQIDHIPPQWRRLWPMQSETAMPQWVFGMSTASSAGEHIISAVCTNGEWKLFSFALDGSIEELNQPFDDLSYIQADKNRVLAVASNHLHMSGLLEIDLSKCTTNYMPSSSLKLADEYLSKPEKLSFKGFMNRETFAWYYPPINSIRRKPPLLVKSHSGPTAMASGSLDLAIQFWTSRGWAVVDVNYGGSTGFGRAYRDRLKGNWGLVDVRDCELAAQFLIDAEKVDPSLIAIEGGSAGGFTTLLCLCSSRMFRVAACRYAVSDLSALVSETHRFEKGYLDYLIGPIDDRLNEYQLRSPLNQRNLIKCPIIFFQGMKDDVVPPAQTNTIAQSLKDQNIIVEVHNYENEGHGFKDGAVKIDVLEKTERFFNFHLKL